MSNDGKQSILGGRVVSNTSQRLVVALKKRQLVKLTSLLVKQRDYYPAWKTSQLCPIFIWAPRWTQLGFPFRKQFKKY